MKKLRPDYIIHGDDWKFGADAEIREDVFKTMKEIGGEVIEISAAEVEGISQSRFNPGYDGVGV